MVLKFKIIERASKNGQKLASQNFRIMIIQSRSIQLARFSDRKY
jgi:hypothetical protein